jgi:small subunit ribosomal protein S7
MGTRLTLFHPPDPPDHDSELVEKFIRCLAGRGQLATARRVFRAALGQLKRRLPDADPLDVFAEAIEHVKPTVEVRSKRAGRATDGVPMQLNKTRQQALAIRWIISASRAKAGRPMYLRLADELMAAYQRPRGR